jgi:hypothetical protein
LHAAKKERLLEEEFRKEKENESVSVLSSHIKKLLQNATIDNDIYSKYGTLCFTFDSLPNEIKEQIIPLIPSSDYIN